MDTQTGFYPDLDGDASPAIFYPPYLPTPPLALQLHAEHRERQRRYASAAVEQIRPALPAPEPAPEPIVPQLADPLATIRAARITVKLIQAVTARYFGLDPAALPGQRRTRQCVQARHVAMWLTSQLMPTRSHCEIARQFNKDHTTIIHALRRIASLGGDQVDGVAAIKVKIEAAIAPPEPPTEPPTTEEINA